MLRFILVIAILITLGGCAQWQELSEGEKTGIIVGGAILVGAAIVANSDDDTIVRNCISTRSIETGCGDKF